MSWSKELELEFFDSCFNTTFNFSYTYYMFYTAKPEPKKLQFHSPTPTPISNFSYTYYMFYTAKTRTKKTSIPLSNSNSTLQLLLDSCNRCCVLPCANLV